MKKWVTVKAFSIPVLAANKVHVDGFHFVPDIRWTKFDVIYYEYGALVLLFDSPQMATKAYNLVREATYDDKQLLALLLPNIQVCVHWSARALWVGHIEPDNAVHCVCGTRSWLSCSRGWATSVREDPPFVCLLSWLADSHVTGSYYPPAGVSQCEKWWSARLGTLAVIQEAPEPPPGIWLDEWRTTAWVRTLESVSSSCLTKGATFNFLFLGGGMK